MQDLDQLTISNQFKPSELTIAVTGDIHLGHHKTPTALIINTLSKAFLTESAKSLDIIVLNGDVFDQSLKLDSDLRTPIVLFIMRLLVFCKKHDIVLRVVEGTPSHDNRQSGLFIELNETIGADCKYIDTLSIEHIERFNTNMLYVPDEWRATSEQTKEEIKELLTAKGLDKVHFSFLHGYFQYQLPECAEDEAHDPEFFHDITEYEIFINHVHVFSQRGRIYAPGSIERLAHGEEGDKGHIRRDAHGVTFVVNKDALKYITVDCTGINLEEAYNKVTATAESLPDGAHVRIVAEREHQIVGTVAEFKKQYPGLNWSPIKIAGKKDSKSVMDPVKIKPIDKIPTLTKDNLLSHLAPRLEKYSDDLRERCLSHMRDVIDA